MFASERKSEPLTASAGPIGTGSVRAGLRLDEPVIVLTCGRSGSTLLRFILDAHPALACPPETGVVDLCTRMGVLSMLLDGPPVGVRPGLTDLATVSIRSWVATTFGSYLVRMGKARWCEKSLGSAESASRFLDLFPKARFICLYRHCMDVIDSALEACPFGLRGYGAGLKQAIPLMAECCSSSRRENHVLREVSTSSLDRLP